MNTEQAGKIEEKYKKIFFDIWTEGTSSDKLMCAVENIIEEMIAGRTKTIEEKDQRIKELEDFLKAHEQWEADFIGEDSMWWPHGENGDVLKGKVYEDFLKLQEQRNELLNNKH